MEKKITADTKIFDALEINPNAGEILMSYGMHCLGCALAHGETVGEAAAVHGADLEKMLEELNENVLSFLFKAFVPLRDANEPPQRAIRQKTDMSRMQAGRNDLVTNGDNGTDYVIDSLASANGDKDLAFSRIFK